MSNLIPEGSYTARAVGEVQFGYTNNGSEYVRLTLAVQIGEGTKNMYRDLFFTEKTAQRSIESLRYCGWTGSDISSLAIGEEGLGDIDASVTIEHETYETDNGEEKTIAKIAWINGDGGGAKVQTPMGESQRKAFGAKFRGLAMQLKPTNAPTGAKPAAPAQRPANGRPPARPAPASDMPPVDWEPGMDG